MPSEFYLTGIKGLFNRRNICIAVKGEYVEKLSKTFAYVICASYKIAKLFDRPLYMLYVVDFVLNLYANLY